jgi:ADP-dependent NAD(P)H-hydrate dehydratase / NAD(P)H-hydrate epimerase
MTHQTVMTYPQRDVYGMADVPLLTAAQAAEMDRAAREQHGVPERVLMENAGRAAALVLQRLYPGGRVVGVAGSGNNGGDLLVMLRVLQAWGRDVALIVAGGRPPADALRHGAELVTVAASAGRAPALLAGAGVVVDGMLGTGSQGAPRGTVAEWIGRLNAVAAPVVALDLPSGVDPTTGRVPGSAVEADVTVTFGWPKIGLLLHPARRHCGRLVAVEIGFPPGSAPRTALALTPDWARRHLPRRAADAHKGTAGRVLLLAGSRGMAGAAGIAGAAASRAGAGLLRIASSADNREILQALVPEATFLDRTRLAHDDVEAMDALVAGPGMGTGAEARDCLAHALDLMPGRPALLDADALNMFAASGAGDLRRAAEGRPLVMTPHARELSRLTGAELAAILEDPAAAARSAAREFACVVLLKGQPSLVAAPDGTLYVSTVGSSDVASAGMGDQLAGSIGAFLAVDPDPLRSAGLGLFMSGRAADCAALGRSLVPQDVSACLAGALAEPGLTASALHLPFVTFDQPPRW